MKKTYVLSIILFLALFCGAIITAGGNILVFLNLPSFIMVAGTAFVLLLGSFSLKEMGNSFSAAFQKSSPNRQEMETALAFFTVMAKHLLIAGFLGTMVGAITMLSLLGEVDSVSFGAALSLTTFLYALILIALVALPFRAGIEKKLAGRADKG